MHEFGGKFEMKEETRKEIPNKRNGTYYLDENRIYVSVTEILSVLAKPNLIHWAALTATRIALANPSLSEKEVVASIYTAKTNATTRGQTIHHFAEMTQKGVKIDVESMPENLKGYAKAFVDWQTSFSPKVICLEKIIWSDEFKYAGKLDMIVEDKEGKNWLIDIKTGKDIYDEVALQLSAYKHAVEEMGEYKIENIAVLLLKEDGSFKFSTLDFKFLPFLACLELYKFLNADKIEKARKKK